MTSARTVSLLELLAALCALYTFMVRTPAGELVTRAVEWKLRSGHHDRPLLGFFDAGDLDGKQLVATLGAGDERVAEAAKVAGDSAALVAGFALASQGRTPGAGATLDAVLTAQGRALLVARGISERELSTPRGRFDAVTRELPLLADELASEDAAVLALFAGAEDVRFAMHGARSERRALSLEALLMHLPRDARDRAGRPAAEALALATAFNLGWPVDLRAPVTSGFGRRINPLRGVEQMHGGLDLAVPEGTDVRAAADGVVIRAGEDAANGRFVVIDHGRGVTTAYCHNSLLKVTRGMRVKRGESIAASGMTGWATGPHVHYQIELSGTPVDPSVLRKISGQVLLAGG